MALTVDYGKLAAKSPKALGMTARKPRPITPPLNREAAHLISVTAACKSQLPIPAGTKRYYLTVPGGRDQHALAAGCAFDHSIRRWYVDNPSHPEDFSNWKPSLVTSADTAALVHGKSPAR